MPTQAVINRLGFNNDGEAAVLPRLARRVNEGGIVGINIGANRDSPDRVADYVRLIEIFAPGRKLCHRQRLVAEHAGLARSAARERPRRAPCARDRMRDRMRARAGPTPLLLKIAPDLSLAELDDIVGVARARKVDGMIVSNTTLSRPPSLQEREKSIEQGGLSGRPLFTLSTRMLAETYVRAEGAFALIGVGGIDSGKTAVEKIKAGASLVQLYSALVFKGLGLVSEIKDEVSRRWCAGVTASWRTWSAAMPPT
jgi:dihydroorotate dehydrogenase